MMLSLAVRDLLAQREGGTVRSRAWVSDDVSYAELVAALQALNVREIKVDGRSSKVHERLYDTLERDYGDAGLTDLRIDDSKRVAICCVVSYDQLAAELIFDLEGGAAKLVTGTGRREYRPPVRQVLA